MMKPTLPKAYTSFPYRIVSVIPLMPNQKRPIFPWCKYQNTRAEPTKILQWADNFSACNWGIVTGQISGLVVLDIDKDDWEFVKQWLPKGLPTPVVRTPRGYHIYYKHPGVTVGNRAWRSQELDFRGDGGYVVAPGSEMDGRKWEWAIAPYDPHVELRDMPTNVRALLGLPELYEELHDA